MKLYNTLTRSIEPVKPLQRGKISLYTCGLTVYSQPHIGNWVAYIYWDVLVRALRAEGYDVTRVQNITDVGHLTSDEDAGEDKMLASALKEGTTAWDVAEKYATIANHEAYDMLKLLRPDHMPRATEYIPQQIAFVQELETNGFTYTIADGVYFDTSKLNDYGKLARLDIDGLQFGARVEGTGKKNPTDFALWKFSPKGQKRDMEWESPWGIGFPGWHLECSVMARELLGDTIDIHTGGIDHIPVHHTNEIAQSESVTRKPFSNVWVHSNHIKVNGTKMSKSLGNIYTLGDIVDRGFDIQAFRLMVLSKHYRTEGNFTWEILEAAQNRLRDWRATADLRWQKTNNDASPVNSLNIGEILSNNLDTPKAVSQIDSYLARLSSGEINASQKQYNDILKEIDALLGIQLAGDDITDKQKKLIASREAARATQNWEESDKLRTVLASDGIVLKDLPNNKTIWSRA